MSDPAATPSAEDAIPSLFLPDPETPGDVASPPEAAAEDAPPTTATDGQEPATEPGPNDKVAQRIAAAKRREERAARERASLHAERAQIESARAEIGRHQAALRLLTERPLEGMKALAIDPKTFLEKIIQDGEVTWQSEAQQLRSELKRLEEERGRERAELEAQRIEATQAQAKAAFASMVSTNADKYPYLMAEFDDDEIVDRAWRVASLHGPDYRARTGEDLSDEEIASFLEDQAKARHEKLQGRRARVNGGTRESGSAPTSPNAPGHVSRPATARTISGRMTGQAQQSARPWTQDDADTESLRILAKAWRDE